MGGSIATKLADHILKEYKEEKWVGNIKGLFVIDVVEGTALDALPYMENVVAKRPKSFPSRQAVVEYGVASGTVRNL